jgi:hypothetical protein
LDKKRWNKGHDGGMKRWRRKQKFRWRKEEDGDRLGGILFIYFLFYLNLITLI